MNRTMLRMLAAVIVSFSFSALCIAQGTSQRISTADKFVISAKAGGINVSEGSVSVMRTTGTSGRLFKGDSLEIGERVSTGTDGRTEILLNPGSFVRLGGSSEFEFASTALDDLKLKLMQGSAMLEVFASKDFKVTLDTPKARFYLIESGIYRIDVMPDGTGKIAVYDGKAQLGDASATTVKKGRQAVLTGSVSKISKFDRDNMDALAIWSRDRAKTLADATASLRNNQNVRTALMRSYLAGMWNIYSSFGLWLYDARYGYCFLPFGAGWGSPYGFAYGNCSCYYQMPSVIYTYNPNYPTHNPPVAGPAAPSTVRIASTGDRSVTPPFVRLQQTGFSGTTGLGGVRTSGNSGYDPGVYNSPSSEPSRSSSPTFEPSRASSAPEPARAPSSAPEPARTKNN